MTKARDLANAGTALTSVSATELGYLDGVTSAVQTQINSKIAQTTAINPTIVDAKGDIVAASAADTPARLAVGSNGTVLTADSAESTGLKWTTPSAGGMTLLSTTTMNSGTATQTVSGIPSTYTALRIIISNGRSSAGDFGYRFRLNGDSGTNYSYAYAGQYWAGGDSTTNLSNLVILGNRTSASTVWSKQGYAVFDIHNYNAAGQAIVTWECINHDGGAGNTITYTGGICVYNASAAVSSFSIVQDSATYTSGQILIYGVK
jgi:hypothetical protein